MSRGVVVPFPAQRASQAAVERHAGGLRRPATVTVVASAFDEALIELTVSRAERFSYASTEHDAWRAVLFAEAKGDLDRIGRIATERLRRATQERTRAAVDLAPSPAPVEMERAA